MLTAGPVAFSLNAGTIWLGCASFLAGMVNSVAGGGSFLSFPALLGLGVPPIQANATNTVALWPGQLTSIAAYRSDLGHNRKLVLPLTAGAAVGGIAGALILLHTAQSTFLHLIPWLLLAAATLFAVSTPLSRRLQSRSQTGQAGHTGPPTLLLALGMALIAVYIGYFGAGGGFLILSMFALARLGTIHHMNALKVVTTTTANGVAVILFIARGEILWQHCLLMMVTGAVGGYVGARGARKVSAELVRGVVTVIGFAVAGYFFWRNGGW